MRAAWSWFALAFLPSVVMATPADGPGLYHAGYQAFQANDFETARARFQAALEALPPSHRLTALTRYNLAFAMERLGRVCDAETAFERYLSFARGRDSETPRVSRATAAITKVGARCRASRAVAVAGGSGDIQGAPPNIADAVAEPSARAVAGWLTLGAGVAGVAVGGYFNASARDEIDTADAAFERFESDRTKLKARTVESSRESAEQQANLSYWLFGVGATLVGVGGWLLLFDEGPAVAPSAAAAELGLAVTGVW